MYCQCLATKHVPYRHTTKINVQDYLKSVMAYFYVTPLS